MYVGKIAASEELREYYLLPLPGATSEAWKYFEFESKNGKRVDCKCQKVAK